MPTYATKLYLDSTSAPTNIRFNKMGSLKCHANGENHAKLKRVQSRPSPSGMRMLAKVSEVEFQQY